ncbi:hypothetical protein ABZZ80_02510 [Streptomyces sp. NPDC006356]
MLTFTVGTGAALEVAEYADFTTGSALYRVTRVGTFTFDWDPSHHIDPEVPHDQEHLRVTYGAGTTCRSYPTLPDAPVMFGLTLVGQETFTMAALDTDPLCLRPFRLVATAPAYAPAGPRRRTNEIVRALARHWLTQPWAPELRRAHEHHWARHTLAVFNTNLEDVEQRFKKLEQDRAFYSDVIDRASTALDSGPVPAPATAPPPYEATTAAAKGGR